MKKTKTKKYVEPERVLGGIYQTRGLSRLVMLTTQENKHGRLRFATEMGGAFIRNISWKTLMNDGIRLVEMPDGSKPKREKTAS